MDFDNAERISRNKLCYMSNAFALRELALGYWSISSAARKEITSMTPLGVARESVVGEVVHPNFTA